MRKPKNIDVELKALEDRARQLKDRKVRQLGELVIAAGANSLEVEMLAGVLVSAAETRDRAQREHWRQRGAGFFGAAARGDPRGPGPNPGRDAPPPGGPAAA